MSTAVLMSGQLRTFAECYPTQRWHVLRHYPDAHYYGVFQHDPHAEEKCAQLLADVGPERVHFRFIADPTNLEITPAMSRAWHQAPFANAAVAYQLLLQHWYQREVYRHFCALNEAEDITAIIRLRADLWFHEHDRLPAPEMREAFTPWWGTFGGINDRFAILGPVAAQAYFETLEFIPHLLSIGAPFHPESLVRASLEHCGCIVRPTLHALFSTRREDTHPESRAGRPMRFPEICPWERRPT